MSDSTREERSHLEEITIRGLGVIESAEIEIKPGLNVITGETGAGKTMLLTALSLVLGGKSDPDLVRNGVERLAVSGRFTLPKTPVGKLADLLEDHQIQLEDGSLLLSRTFSKDGKSRALLAGEPTTAAVLSQFGGELIEIHGQHGTLSLTKPARQRQVLDAFGGEKIERALDEYQESVRRYQALEERIYNIKRSLADSEREIELLSELADAFEKVKPREGELEEISALISRLESVEELRAGVSGALSAIDNEEVGALTAIASGKRTLAPLRGKDAELDEIAGKLEELQYQLADVNSDLTAYLDALEADPNQLQVLLDRRAALVTFAKRFGTGSDRNEAYATALGAGSTARGRISDLAGGENRLDEMADELAAILKTVVSSNNALSKLRIEAAKRFSSAVTAELSELSMPNADFECRITSREINPTELHPFGSDIVEILFTAHRGGALLPISKAASGGELSRLMLAIEVVVSETAEIGTYLFDEIDAGIGGKAALEVGRRLKQLAKTAQVIVVTHLPQVAIWADHHLRVLKDESGSVTQSTISVIEGAERELEIARMLSGLSESEHAQEHARELLKLGKS